MMCPEDTSIAFIGGGCNAAALDAVIRLADAGYEVLAGPHDPREGAILADAGILCLHELADAVENCQVVLTSCANPDAVEELYLGQGGLLEMMEPGAYVVDLTFTTPQLAREIQAMAAISEVEFIDAPIVCVGEHEDAVCFIGGEKNATQGISPLLPYLAPTIQPQEEPGEGQFAAMMSYIGLAGSLMGTIEAMSLAHIAGFSNKSALNVLASTNAASRALIEYAPRMMNHDYAGRLRVSEFLDALDTALCAAEDLDVTIPMVETAYQLFDLLSVVGGDDMDITALALLYEDEQTCADFGLDWALADNARTGYTDEPGGEQPSDLRSMLEQALNDAGVDLSNSGGIMGGSPFGGPSGFMGNGKSDGDDSGRRGRGGFPNASGFYSVN